MSRDQLGVPVISVKSSFGCIRKAVTTPTAAADAVVGTGQSNITTSEKTNRVKLVVSSAGESAQGGLMKMSPNW